MGLSKRARRRYGRSAFGASVSTQLWAGASATVPAVSLGRSIGYV